MWAESASSDSDVTRAVSTINKHSLPELNAVPNKAQDRYLTYRATGKLKRLKENASTDLQQAISNHMS